MKCFSHATTASYTRLCFRVVFDILLVVTALAGPWWLAVAIAIFSILFFGAYEAIFAGIVLDSLYMNGSTGKILEPFTFTILLCCFVSFSFFITPYIRGIHRSHSL